VKKVVLKSFELEQKPIKIIGVRLSKKLGGYTSLVDVFQHIGPEARVGLSIPKKGTTELNKIIELEEKIKNKEKLTEEETKFYQEYYSDISDIKDLLNKINEIINENKKIPREKLDEKTKESLEIAEKIILNKKEEFEEELELMQTKTFLQKIAKHIKKEKKGNIIALIEEEEELFKKIDSERKQIAYEFLEKKVKKCVKN